MRLVASSIVYLSLLVLSIDGFSTTVKSSGTNTRRVGGCKKKPSVVLHYAKLQKVSSSFLKDPTIDGTLLEHPSSLKTSSAFSGHTAKKLIPLSTTPILCVSSHPLLSNHESEKLREWCRNKLKPNETINSSAFDGSEESVMLECLRQRIDALVGYDGSGEEVTARYISYNAKKEKENRDSTSHQSLTTSSLLPDGLHVDTNNGKFFRHWTVLVYLETCQTSGATTFPLAARLNKDMDALTNAHRAASQLILTENTLHTRISDQKEALDLGQEIEKVALKIYTEDSSNKVSVGSTGIRVVPKAGHCCIFSSLMANGMTNPFSIHGGEALLNDDFSKDALTFFYEVPITKFSSQEELGQEVAKRENFFLNLHDCAGEKGDTQTERATLELQDD